LFGASVPSVTDESGAVIGKEMAADGVVRLANDPRSNKSTSGPMIGDRTADAVSAVVVRAIQTARRPRST